MPAPVAGFPTPEAMPKASSAPSRPALDPSLDTPLHAQLAALIRARIDARDLRPGQAIPSEADLMDRYHVSRGTVRRAIRTLVEEGYLATRKGSGTFVAEGGLVRSGVRRPLSFGRLLAARGLGYTTQVLARQVMAAPRAVAVELSLATGSPALFLRRVRSVTGDPLVCQESWENLAACPGLEGSDFQRESLFDAVERCSGRHVAQSEVRYRSLAAGEEHASYLRCDPTDPVLVLEQRIALDDGTPIEWSLTWLRPGETVAGVSLEDQIDPAPGRGEAGAPLSAAERRRLERGALAVRRGVVEIAHRYEGTPFHFGGALSMAELVSVLYFHTMRTGRDGTPWEERDRLVVSKAHASVALYPAMLEVGLITQDDLDRGLFGPDAVLFKHPRRDPARGIETSGGSLGMGLGYAAGLALALSRKGLPGRVFCVVGDGECDEGSVWESAAFAGHQRLGNLTVVVDANGMQLDGPTSQVMDNGPIQRKFAAFGFECEEVDGHDVASLARVLDVRSERPRCVVARTMKGKGLSFAEMCVEWHDKALDQAHYELALAELAAQEGAIG